MTQEIWDLYDSKANKVNLDHQRGTPIPQGLYHKVVEIFVITTTNEVLLTQRSPEKTWPLKWEVSAGSILKGETSIMGAQRELFEETGIHVNQNQLIPIYSYVHDTIPSIFDGYLVILDKDTITIKLQAGETCNYQYMPYDQFTSFISTDEFVVGTSQRFALYHHIIEKIIESKND